MIPKYKDRSQVKSKCIGTRLKPDEYDKFDKLAESKGYITSIYLRQLILDKLSDNVQANSEDLTGQESEEC